MEIRAYLDNNATTRLSDEAFEAMRPYLTDLFLNPSSIAGDIFGLTEPLTRARTALAELLGEPELPDRIFLTSGASEANSWAVFAATAGAETGHIISTAIEHPSMLAALDACRARGWTVDLGPCDQTGRIDAEQLLGQLRPDTMMVSVMLANNETGVIQSISELFEAVRERTPEVLLHVDATQAIGRVPVDLGGALEQVDLLSLSAHKFHGPKGIGALFARSHVALPPLIHGHQENGLRGGTSNAAAAAGLAIAARQALNSIEDMPRVARLRDTFEGQLMNRFAKARILGANAPRLPNTSAILLPGLRASEGVETLAMQGIIVGDGSACASGSPAPSHVLTAMGLDYASARSVLRVSLSRDTREEELHLLIEGLGSLAQSGSLAA